MVQRRTLSDAPQHIPFIPFWQIQITSNQLWVRPDGRIDFCYKPDCLFAVTI